MPYPTLQQLTWLPETDPDVDHYIVKLDDEEVATVVTPSVELTVDNPGIHMITVEAYKKVGVVGDSPLISRCFYRFYFSGFRTRLIGIF